MKKKKPQVTVRLFVLTNVLVNNKVLQLIESLSLISVLKIGTAATCTCFSTEAAASHCRSVKVVQHVVTHMFNPSAVPVVYPEYLDEYLIGDKMPSSSPNVSLKMCSACL